MADHIDNVMKYLLDNQTSMINNPTTTNDSCPNCGYCRHCGRGGGLNNYHPSYTGTQTPAGTTSSTTCGASIGSLTGVGLGRP